MLRKALPLVTLLGLISQASADRNPENLRGLRAADICPIATLVSVANIRDTAFEKKLESALNEQDVLFNLGVMKRTNIPNCTQRARISFKYAKTTAGSYIYVYEFTLSSKEGIIKLKSSQSTVDYSTYYNMSGYGISTNLENLQRTMILTTKELFQEFTLDWRKIR